MTSLVGFAESLVQRLKEETKWYVWQELLVLIAIVLLFYLLFSCMIAEESSACAYDRTDQESQGEYLLKGNSGIGYFQCNERPKCYTTSSYKEHNPDYPQQPNQRTIHEVPGQR